MKNYLFPKFFQTMTVEALADFCRDVGVDGPTLMIRDGYWVEPGTVFETLPAFVKTVTDRGAEVVYADTPYDMDGLDKLDNELALMRDQGISMFRVNYIAKDQYPARMLHDKLRADMAKAENAARKHGLKAVVQIHGSCYPHNATSAYFACQACDPQWLGVKLDPGNNLCQEGYEYFPYQIELLKEYIAAIGEKDARLIRNGDPNGSDKGWRREFVPADRGIADYELIFGEMKKNGIAVPGILMPFYHENDIPSLIAAFKEEVAYFKRCQTAAGL